MDYISPVYCWLTLNELLAERQFTVCSSRVLCKLHCEFSPKGLVMSNILQEPQQDKRFTELEFSS